MVRIRSFTVKAIVLHHFDLGEADRVLTVFSQERGKISVIAKGVRRITSRKSGSVEIGNHATFFLGEGANFYVLQEVSVIDTFSTLKSSIGTLKYAYYVLELINVLLPDHEAHQDVFLLLLQILHLLDSHPRRIFVRAFEVKLMRMFGYLAVDPEELLSGNVSGSEFLTEPAVVALTLLQEGSWEEIAGLDLNEKDAKSLEQFMRFRIERESQRQIKSLEYFN